MGAALQADGEYEVRGDGLKDQKEKRSMNHFAGLDVSVKETSVCIMDDTARIVREVKVGSEPEALLAALKNPAFRFKVARRLLSMATAFDCKSLRWVSSIRSF